MLITGRQAAHLLAARGVSRASVGHLLATGIAGPAVPTSSAQLYDGDAVADLAERPLVDPGTAAQVAPHGYLVARLPRNRVVRTDAPWSELADVVAGPWRVDATVRLVLVARVSVGVRLPLVLTVAGFAVAGADITDVVASGEAEGLTAFQVEPPREWFAAFRGRLCVTGRGRPTQLLGWPAWRQQPRPRAQVRPLQQ